MELTLIQHHEVQFVRYFDFVANSISEKNVGINIFSPFGTGLHIFANLFFLKMLCFVFKFH